MNSAEQATHRTKTAQLEARVATLETVVDAMARFLTDWRPFVDGKIALHSTTLEALTYRPESTQTPPAAPDEPAD